MNNRVFVVYAQEDKKGMALLPKTLGVEFQFRNSDKVYARFGSDDYITTEMKIAINENIVWSDMIVVLVGKRTSYVKWIDWCCEEANLLGKKIIYIYLDEAESLPDNARQFGHSAVGMEKAEAVIKGVLVAWESPSGDEFPIYSADNRSNC